MLAQHDFKCISALALSLVRAIFDGPNHTVHVENMFQRLKDFSRDVNNGMKSRPKRMYECVQSDLLKDFQLPEVQPIEAAAGAHTDRLP